MYEQLEEFNTLFTFDNGTINKFLKTFTNRELGVNVVMFKYARNFIQNSMGHKICREIK